MFLPDINILVHAFNRASPHHSPCVTVVHNLLRGPQKFVLPDLVTIGFLRITTLRALYKSDVSLPASWAFIETLKNSPHQFPLPVSSDFESRFKNLSLEMQAEGNLLNDVYLASLALELGATLLSGDRDFSHIPGVRWQRVY